MYYGYGKGTEYSGGSILFCVGRKLSSHAEVDDAHVVESWVRDPYGHEDLSHGADVLLHTSLVDGNVAGFKYACTDLVREYF